MESNTGSSLCKRNQYLDKFAFHFKNILDFPLPQTHTKIPIYPKNDLETEHEL